MSTATRKAWESAKAKHNAILLFRIGDFLEAFYEDADTVSEVCEIEPTLAFQHRDKPAINIAGLPWSARASYIRQLIQAGHRVAVYQCALQNCDNGAQAELWG